MSNYALIFFFYAISFSAMAGDKPKIVIIIDDMGYQLTTGNAALNLPKAVTMAFLPRAPHTDQLFKTAVARGYTLMLHQPMESINHSQLDQGGITLEMTDEEIKQTLLENLKRLPQVVGLNNHMGSRLTQYDRPMHDIMNVVQKVGSLLFIDSRTTILSVADEIAKEKGIPSRKRDIFLDNQIDSHKIEAQLDKLIKIAKRQGSAIAIGHPYPETIAVLAKRLPMIKEVELVSIKALLSEGIQHEKSLSTLSPGL